MLKITDLNTHYGLIHALKGIDVEISKGEVVSLIGSNGAGKSTLLNTIVGITKASQGKVEFMGNDITNRPPHTMTTLGISISPEGREVFPALTVEENLRLGAYTVKDKNKIASSYERVYEIFPRLKERIKQTAGTLSGGEQQMLAIGRALMCNPDLLLLDEPSGVERTKIKTAKETAEILLGKILEDFDYSGSEVAVLVNGLGGTPLMELYILNMEIMKLLEEKNISVYKILVGNYMTALDMTGCSLTLMKLDDELKVLLDTPCNTPALNIG